MRPLPLYFHGLPGSAAELTAFGPDIGPDIGPDLGDPARQMNVVARGNALTAGPGDAYFERLAAQIRRDYSDQPLVLVGFSLGAAAALRVASHLGAQVQRIDLVSPAAPLQLGDFLAGMAGAPVFRAALAGRAAFAALTFVQAQAARFAPAKMAAALMAKAQGGDRELAADPRFIAALAQSLRTSLLAQRAAYSAEIHAYVADWRADLARVRQPVAIWQGSEDDWTPPAMAQALADALPGRPQVTMVAGLSHFSALRHYLAQAAAA